MIEAGKKDIRSYVLRVGRLSKLQKQSLETLSDQYCIPFDDKILDFKLIFGKLLLGKMLKTPLNIVKYNCISIMRKL